MPQGDQSVLVAWPFAPLQSRERDLDGAFRKAGVLRQQPQTGRNRTPMLFLRHPVQREINKKGGGLAIVADQIPHQDIDDVIVNRDRTAAARHGPTSTRYID